MTNEIAPKDKVLTNRHFLKETGGAALTGVAAGTFLAGSRKALGADMAKKRDFEADVAIIGSGRASRRRSWRRAFGKLRRGRLSGLRSYSREECRRSILNLNNNLTKTIICCGGEKEV